MFSGHRVWIYAQSVQGRFQKLHRWSGRVLLAFLVLVPLVPWGDHPLVQLDLATKHVYFFGMIFTPRDGFLIALAGLLAAFSLFFFTSLFGRVWCGYACPQTVFLEEFVRPIETFFEGERGVRRARDQGPWTAGKVARKAGKHLAFAAVAALVSLSFLSWFSGARAVWTGAAGGAAYATAAVFTAVWYADFAWFREQLCNYVCPYARFQGALCDDESLVVQYDTVRGEPRNARTAKAIGNCVDCNKCVSVCPQGIDIRDGFQLECIMCGRCIDACDGVMGKLGHAPLIGYSTIAAAEGRKTRLLRPRTVAYAALMTGLAAGIAAIVAAHQPLEVKVAREPGSLYSIDPDGMVRNTFLLDIANNDSGAESRDYAVRVEGLPDGAEVVVPPVTLGEREHRTVPLVIRVPATGSLARTLPLEVEVRTDGGRVRAKTTFKTPGS